MMITSIGIANLHKIFTSCFVTKFFEVTFTAKDMDFNNSCNHAAKFER